MKLADQPHHRLTINELSEEQINLFIEGIRARRLEPVRIYREAQELKVKYRAGQTRAKIDKKMAVFNKASTACEKSIARLEKLGFDLKALLFQLTELDGVANEETGHSGDASQREPPENS